MGLNSGDELPDAQVSDEEKILVSVRLRPLNDKELAQNDVADWECINNTTIMIKNNNLPDRSVVPVAYSFDRVFGCDNSTRQVYEEAAKSVALSVMSGINSSIFAYGQTSSGKTYTMTGITEHTIADIYDYMNRHSSREFVLKFSAMEIYNEAVRDLLSGDGTPLRLLDDPERGTVVEKLTEITLRDQSHLKELLLVCEAERKIGETSLNEMSSRSHQILRLTVYSTAREFRSSQNSSSLTATVHFVDLAGSERASQTSSAGTRLKEGCHINRSLLTLGTVIRKLSKGKNGHIPFRDSKLTRILQNSLGGNARTAIICTMSPAHSHAEQSRNTLLFASCAKQVSTSAQVNVVMSEKALVKQLQRELARLEAQLKNLQFTSSSCDSLKEKELVIEKMDKEIQDLTQQRDQAQFRIKDLLRCASSEYLVQRPWDEVSFSSGSLGKSAFFEEYGASEASEILDPSQLDVGSNLSRFSNRHEDLSIKEHEDSFPEPSDEQFLCGNTSPTMALEKYFGPDPTRGWEKLAQRIDSSSEDNCKEVQCIETYVSPQNLNYDTPLSSGKGDRYSEAETLVKVKEDETNVDHNVDSDSMEQSSCSSVTEMSNSSSADDLRSTSCKEIRMTVPISPRYKILQADENISTEVEKNNLKGQEDSKLETDANLEKEKSPENESTDEKNFKDEMAILKLKSDDKQIQTDLDLSAEKFSKKLDNVSENALGEVDDPQLPSDWSKEFERQRRNIIELWDTCNISLVHRTSFFLLFKGGPSDSIYMEVELRRLTFLKASEEGSQTVKSNQVSKQSLLRKELNRERNMLSKLMLKKLSSKEREALFEKWGIGLKTKKRRLQLTQLIWRDIKDMEHIKESANVVAKLVGLEKPGQALKAMVGLTFPTPSIIKL